MAQGDQRPRHSRHPSRILRLGTSNRVTNTQQPSKKTPSVDAETINYVKKILCAHPVQHGSSNDSTTTDTGSKTLDELLPPLTSSNEVDVQLYAIIAVVLNQFVQSWYSRITPDNEFIHEVVKIIAHCTRGVEQRLKRIDLEGLLLDELPGLLVAHIDGMICSLQVSRATCLG